MKLAGALAGIALAFALPVKSAHAFCGFYVAGADTQLVADASQVVMMREGTRTVLSMQNDYKGPPADFAMVVPVPVVLQKENVKTLPHDIFARVEKLSAPRLVEYWERDPCAQESEGIGLGNIGTIGHGAGTGTGQGFGGGGRVKIEAQFEVGEYEIVILSTKDAAALEQWLKENGYKIPAGSEPYFKPYVQAGSKFFVAKVNVAKVKMENGVATLSPLRFHYDSEKFELPVRLGLVNSAGKQDLIVNILAAKRYEVANYPNVTIPTNIDVAESARSSFGEVYAALFDRTVEQNPKAVVTEYAWPASSCDPCPGGTSGLTSRDIVTLGQDVLPSSVDAQQGAAGSGSVSEVKPVQSDVTGGLPPEVVRRIVRQNQARMRYCYEQGLAKKPALAGNVKSKIVIATDGSVKNVADAGSNIGDPDVVKCIERAFSSMSFPTADKETSVTWASAFSMTARAGGASGFGGFGGSGRFGGPSLVLTRLHARYGKESLGADLVFKEAEAIVGGREMPNESGKLEDGSTKSSTNSFQARYAIRHPWPGKIACEKPVRNRWGGPWPTWDAGSGETVAATKLAYVPRGRVDLSKMLGNVAGAMPSGDTAVMDASAASASAGDAGAGDAGIGAVSPKSTCGCRTPGGAGSSGTGILFGFALAAAAFARRLVCSRSR